jgi:putative redox protein
MAVESLIVYQGHLHCEARHGPSGAVIYTDAPTDNGGKGEAFSPTDLVGAALGSCIATIMGLVAKTRDINLTGTKVRVVKEMVNRPHRMIGSLQTTVTIPASAQLSDDDKTRLENAARHCPVHQSLHPEIDAPIEFVYE